MSQQQSKDTDRAQSFADYLDAAIRLAYDAGLDAALDMLAAGPEPSTPEEEAARLAAIGEAALQYGRSLQHRAPGTPIHVAAWAVRPSPAPVPSPTPPRAKAHEQEDHGGHSH